MVTLLLFERQDKDRGKSQLCRFFVLPFQCTEKKTSEIIISWLWNSSSFLK